MSKQKSLYGYLAGVFSAAILQPLQNIKVALMLPPKNMQLTNNFVSNIIVAFQYLRNQGKLKPFYKGLVPNVIKTGCSSAIFFWSLRTIQSLIQKQTKFTSFIASFTGRVLSAVATNPIGVVQTRLELAGEQRWKGSLIHNLRRIYTVEGIQGLFKGTTASCYKQGFFAGFYYTMYLQGKKFGYSNLFSGLVSGIIATALTHPFQIIRAQIQVSGVINNTAGNQLNTSSTFTHLMNLSRTGTIFRGLAPRLIKKPFANTIAFIVFEILQKNQKKKSI